MEQFTLADFDDYWALLPTKDSDVYFEIQNYLESPYPGGETDFRRIFKKSTCAFFEANLVNYPYPMCQIVRCFPSSISGQMFYDALLTYAELPQLMRERKWNLFSLLANICVVDKWLNKCEQFVMPALFDQCHAMHDELFELPLVLLANGAMALTKSYAKYEMKLFDANPFTVNAAFASAVNKRIHFLENIFYDEFRQQLPAHAIDCINLIKIVISIVNGVQKTKETFDDIQRQFEEQIRANRMHSGGGQLMMYNELRRIFRLYQYVRTHKCFDYQMKLMALRTFSQRYNCIDFLHGFDDGELIATTGNYASIRELMTENQLLNERINIATAATTTKPSELSLYDQYFAIQLLADVMFLNGHVKNYDEIVRIKCNEIKDVVDRLDDAVAFIECVESLYATLFMRWEHVNGTSATNIGIGRMDHSTSLTTFDETDTSDDGELGAKRLQRQQSNHKAGFVCTFIVLKNMLNVLHSSIVNRRTDIERINVMEIHDRFERLGNEVTDAKWRLALFDILNVAALNRVQIPKETKQLLTPFYGEVMTQANSSSDEESEDRSGRKMQASMARRKPRRKTIQRRHEPSTHSTDVEPRMLSTQLSMVPLASCAHDGRMIIGKMLGPPLNLVAICMSSGDTNEARKIIKENSLETSALAHELKYIEHMNHLKSQLKEFLLQPIYPADNKMDTDYSVEEIKNLVVHGFEASQVLNLLEQFIATNAIIQAQETRMILERFAVNYPYLDLYTGTALQGISVADFLLSVTNNSDMCFNIYNMLTKLWDKETTRIERLVNQMGYYGAFKHMLGTLSLYNISREHSYGIQHVLANECYLFNASEMAHKLKQEQTYARLQRHDLSAVATIQGLKENIIEFEVFNKKDGNLLSYVFYYSINMNRLTNFKHLNFKEIDAVSLQQILEIDLFSLIGEIVFDNKSAISLTDIEAIVCNLNTNLLHVISMNTCPIISICGKFVPDTTQQLQQILDILSENAHSHVVHDTLDASQKQRRRELTKFQIKNKDILTYIHRHNALIAYLMGEIHDLKCAVVEQEAVQQINRTFLENVLNMDELQIRKSIFDTNHNRMVAALNFDYFNLNTLKQLIAERNYRSALEIMLHCQEIHYKRYHPLICRIQDILIQKLLPKATVSDEDVRSHYEYIEHISCLQLKTTILLDNVESIHDHALAMRLIRTILLHNRLNDEIADGQVKTLKRYLLVIKLYADIAFALSVDNEPQTIAMSWINVMEMSRSRTESLLNQLIERHAYELCHQWIDIHPLNAQCVIKPQFVDRLLRTISNPPQDQSDSFTKVCESLLKIMVIQMNTTLLDQLKNRQLLNYLVDFLIEQSAHENQTYRNYKISLRILDVVGEKESETLWPLIQDPMLIIEQYILNTKFETLASVLQAIRPQICVKSCKICVDSKQGNICPTLRGSGQYFKQSHGDNGLQRTYITYKSHTVSVDCIDYLLRMYAAKALDFRISEGSSTSGDVSVGGENSAISLDSLCGTFVMPRDAPDKCNWVRDEEATHCMCCKRSVFTMLTRRHHCRRCGRVICHSCSTKRMHIPKLYADVMVRVCDDCYRQTDELNNAAKFVKTDNNGSPQVSLPAFPLVALEKDVDSCGGWRFSGHVKHDNLLREEFSYEYAPSASLCLNILSLHTPGTDCGNFLLNYCQKFETLLRPLQPGHLNPEVDYAFVTRILYCLSLAAKVHGGNPECTKIREHAEIINSVVLNGCESLLPMESINTFSLRKLRDALVVAEKWSLATELSLKCGFPKTGIMAAWGIACLRSGCFETAREKFTHCLTRTCSDEDRIEILDLLTMDETSAKHSKKTFKFTSKTRATKVQPLLQEIIAVLETTCHPLHSDVLQKATIISQSNRSLASIRSRKKDTIPMHEPAVNILHTLSNLKQIAQGKYVVKTHKPAVVAVMTSSENNGNASPVGDTHEPVIGINTRFYTESLHYLISYGLHVDVLRFLIKYQQIVKALKYSLLLQIPSEQFIQTIIMPHLKNGRLRTIVEHMIEMDDTLIVWKEYIIKTCLLLEKRRLLNSLYQMQLLLQDTVRASMTCVKFYTMGCATYSELKNNAFHLVNAQKHLKSELELCQWEEIKVASGTRRPDENQSLVMKMDAKSLNQHINTIWMQIEAAKFLAKCEECDKETIKLIPKISMLPCTRIPTLFGTAQDKIILASLILICGTNIEEGFGLAYRIVQDLSLNADKIYAIVTKYVSLNNRLQDVEKLIDCIKSNSNQMDTQLCDDILSLAVQTAFSVHGGQYQMKSIIEQLIRQIDDVGIQIDCHILSGQLKSAYLLAVQHKRVQEIKRILRHADKTNQLQIKKLCEKKLMAIESDG